MCLLVFIFLFNIENYAVVNNFSNLFLLSDSTLIDSVGLTNDSINIVNDSVSITNDSVILSKKDDKFKLSSIITYNSDDSSFMDLTNEKMWLYGNANVKYEDLDLTAHQIMIDFKTNTLYATCGFDSTGNEIGIPDFKKGDLKFKSNELSYNFDSEKGLIKNVIMTEGDGYIHGTVVKKVSQDVTNIGKGLYTTCNLRENPHFALRYTKAKVIANNKIVTGPAYIEVEEVPLPLALPFGLFPNKKGRSSGLIIPQYGESANRGFFLENGGYYWGINDYLDLTLVGDIYTRGSWALKPKMNYKKRYKYSGSFNFNYAVTVLGVKGTSDYSKKTDFFINWSHRQDPKASPNSVFSASVKAGSSSYNQYNPSTVNDYLNNNFASSLAYSLQLGSWGNLTTGARHNQNVSTKSMSLTLPEVSFSVNRMYPLKKKIATGKAKWYEKISIAYNFDMRNEINAPDSIMLRPEVLEYMQNGAKHTIPINATFKIFKYFSWSNTANYTERWYTKSINKTWHEQSVIGNDTIPGYVSVDTISGFKAARDYNLSSSVSTTVYGMKQFSKGFLRAIRHVVYPSVGFSYTPDFSKEKLGYYKTVQKNQEGEMEKYSVFGGAGSFTPLFGVPGYQENGNINFGLKNSLEIKVRSKNDTVTGTKKVKLIENLSINTSYNLAKDSLNWAPIQITANTTLFDKIRISFNSAYDLYATDSLGRQINRFQYQVDKRLARFMQSSWNVNFSYDLKPRQKSSNRNVGNINQSNQAEMQDIRTNPQNYIDWNNPWSLRFDYRLGFTNTYSAATNTFNKRFVQTLNVTGDISITKKWKVTVNTGYDLQTMDFTFTQLNIYRDLHCWEIRFNWIPYGQLKSWNFQINAKSALLQDLKLTRKKDFRDNLQL
ncbi:MAG: putative LPS assembly protein LptD [Lentimicrobiaceae bacterium]|nr:putative LPS assembly protein LptD [Lentimicrobiaceae bacterium]